MSISVWRKFILISTVIFAASCSIAPAAYQSDSRMIPTAIAVFPSPAGKYLPDNIEIIVTDVDLAAEKADLIGLARVLWADPQWPAKARAGKQDEIAHCRPACNACMQLVMQGKPALCPHWDKATRELYRQILGQG